MNELNNAVIFDLLRARADREHRELLWTMRKNDKLYKKFNKLLASGKLYVPSKFYDPKSGILRTCDRMGNVVFSRLCKTRRHRRNKNPDGKRKTTRRLKNDGGTMATRQTAWVIPRDKPNNGQEHCSHLVRSWPRAQVPFAGNYS